MSDRSDRSDRPDHRDRHLRERLLAIMDRKHHARWPAFTKPGLRREQLAIHFGQEFATYVRDFPIFLARVLGHAPPESVRPALAANLYEEQTGGLSGGVDHPELFLRMIDGLGIDRTTITSAKLLPEAAIYRAYLDAVTEEPPWVVGAAVATIFVEGSVHEREELAGTRKHLPLDETIARHPMVVHYGCPPAAMGLVRAHRIVESGHRKDAWRMVLEHADRNEDAVVAAVQEASLRWHSYRDAVCDAAGIGA
jgi:pyrroloquinoline quinone (PQQ) biosynthesis protein C